MQQPRNQKTLNRVLLTAFTALFFLTQTAQAASRYVFIHTDMLGSPMATTDERGNIISRENVTPYGDSLGKRDATNSVAVGSPEHGSGYTGHVRDRDLGLTYMQARYYDPTIGRFMGVDPVGFLDNGDPAYFNRYAYAGNNPYKYVDPDGREIEPVGTEKQISRITNLLLSIESSSPFAGKVIQSLQNSDKLHTIGDNGGDPINVGEDWKNFSNGVGAGSKTYVILSEDNPIAAAQLFHELSHAFFKDMGIAHPNTEVSLVDGEPIEEHNAINFENVYRAESGQRYRNGWYDDGLPSETQGNSYIDSGSQCIP